MQNFVKDKDLASFDIIGGRYKNKHPDGYLEFKKRLERAPLFIDSVNVKGKFMWWRFFELGPRKNLAECHMWCTYGMSGQWSTELANKHTGATMSFVFDSREPAGVLNFDDPRHFGTLKFVNDPALTVKKLATLGPDMLNDPPDLAEFELRLGKRFSKTLAEALMDQSVVSGVGNYVKAEALYLAELSPHRTVSSLKAGERQRLRDQIITVMKASYATGGATISTYRNPDGKPGEAQRRFAVYGNKTDPMGNPVIREETKDGRTTHWVPSIQR